MYKVFLSLAVALTLLTGGAFAQDAETTLPAIQVAPSAVVRTDDGLLDFAAWTQTADRIETALGVGRASDTVFKQLREQLVDWRAAFAVAKDENNININTLENQISTLGPTPAEGESEPAILTQRRDELTAALNLARQPVQAAQEAHSRTNVLISEVDALIRTRQADALISLGASPLDPAHWPKSLHAITNSLSLAVKGIRSAWGTEIQTAELKRGLPLTIVLIVFGLILLVRGRRWVVQVAKRMFERASGRGRGVIGLLMSFGQVIAPVAGILTLSLVLYRIGVLDLRAQVYVDTLALLGLSVFAALWLGGRVFGAPTTLYPVIELESPSKARQGRLVFVLLGLVFGLRGILQDVAAFESFEEETYSVLSFPLFVFSGLLLVRLGQLLSAAKLGGEEESLGLRNRVIPLLGRVVIALGVVAPIAAAIGYTALADQMIYPAILTLFLLGLLQVLSFFISDLFAFITRRKSEVVREGLAPILVSLALMIAALPVLALIWGAQVTDLTELWTTLGQGYALGDARITPRSILSFAMVFAIGVAVTKIIQSTLKTTILPKTRMDIGGRNAVTSGLGYTGILLAGIAAFSSAGVDLSSLAIVAGALSLGIGFGLQNVVSNFVSGIILLIERPVSEGDWIEVGGQMGYVRDISVRSTRIETFDRTDVIIPNSDLISGVVTNYTRGNLVGRVIVPVGVAYGSDTRRIEKILQEVAEAHPMVTVNPAPSVVFQGFGADALDFEIRAILKDVNFILSVKSEMNHEIAKRFVEEGIEIPFAQRDIWLRNPEALTGGISKPSPSKQPVTDASKARASLTEADLHSDDAMGSGEGDE